jgi:Asp/Glu/hydantoin racemase
MIARDPDGALKLLGDACDACIREDHAEAVILGGVGLIGLAERLQQDRDYPVICSVMAGLREVEQVSVLPARKPAHGPVGSVGLSRELEALMAHQT